MNVGDDPLKAVIGSRPLSATCPDLGLAAEADWGHRVRLIAHLSIYFVAESAADFLADSTTQLNAR